MSFRKKTYPGIVCLIFILTCLQNSFSQSQFISIDTSEYLPLPYGLDYNLMVAASLGYTDEVNRLLGMGANIAGKTSEAVTPLMFAVANNKFDCVKLLLEKGADPNIETAYYESPLLAAVKNGNNDIAEILIRNKADLNFADHSGVSPLHYSAIYGNMSLTDMLIYYGSSIDITTNDGTTPLMAAVWVGFADVTDLLIQNGADVNRKDNNGFSPFLIAAQNGDTVIMNLLIKAGADIYETNKYNYNALCLAIKENHIQAVNFLLHEGNLWTSDIIVRLNPISVAIKYGRKEIIELLKNNKIYNKKTFSIDQVSISVSSKLTSHDLFTGVSIKVKEPLLNGGIVIGYDFKPFDSRVIIQTGELLFYQYIDRRSIFYTGLFKDIDLTDKSSKSYWSLSFSLTGAYTFGNHFNGTNIAPKKKLIVMPSMYLKWQISNFEVFSGLELMKTEFYKVGPLWLRFGCSYNLYFDKVRSPGKVISWY